VYLHDEVAVEERAKLRIGRGPEELVQRTNPDGCGDVRS
jgi:hypothetical protein